MTQLSTIIILQIFQFKMRRRGKGKAEFRYFDLKRSYLTSTRDQHNRTKYTRAKYFGSIERLLKNKPIKHIQLLNRFKIIVLSVTLLSTISSCAVMFIPVFGCNARCSFLIFFILRHDGVALSCYCSCSSTGYF